MTHQDLAAAIDIILRDAGDCPHILIGPAVWQPSDGLSARHWYFVVAASSERSSDGFAISEIDCGSQLSAAGFRFALKAELLKAKRPCVVHDFDDELEMARWAEAIWPGKRSEQIRAGLEAERAATC